MVDGILDENIINSICLCIGNENLAKVFTSYKANYCFNPAFIELIEDVIKQKNWLDAGQFSAKFELC